MNRRFGYQVLALAFALAACDDNTPSSSAPDAGSALEIAQGDAAVIDPLGEVRTDEIIDPREVAGDLGPGDRLEGAGTLEVIDPSDIVIGSVRTIGEDGWGDARTREVVDPREVLGDLEATAGDGSWGDARTREVIDPRAVGDVETTAGARAEDVRTREIIDPRIAAGEVDALRGRDRLGDLRTAEIVNPREIVGTDDDGSED